MILRLLFGLVLPVSILLVPDPKEPEPNERQKHRDNSSRRRRRSRSGGTRPAGDARELEATPGHCAEKPENSKNDDVREASGSGPGGPVRGELDSATEVDLQPVAPAADPGETPQP